MELEQALSSRVPFGKWKDRSVEDILHDEATYLGWLVSKARLNEEDPERIRSGWFREALLIVYGAHKREIDLAVLKDKARHSSGGQQEKTDGG